MSVLCWNTVVPSVVTRAFLTYQMKDDLRGGNHRWVPAGCVEFSFQKVIFAELAHGQSVRESLGDALLETVLQESSFFSFLFFF